MTSDSDFPSNSHRSRKPPEEKKVSRVTSGTAVRRKKSLGKQFRETFIGGDGRTAMNYVIFDVLIPAAKDALADAGSQGIERLIFGDKRRRGPGPRPTGPTGFISYNRMGMGDPRQTAERTISKRARAQHDFDEIFLQSRTEAEDVIDRMFDLVSRYDQATVADLYELVGLSSTHTDQRWGWADLRGAGVARVRGGYILDLPEPQPLN